MIKEFLAMFTFGIIAALVALTAGAMQNTFLIQTLASAIGF